MKSRRILSLVVCLVLCLAALVVLLVLMEDSVRAQSTTRYVVTTGIDSDYCTDPSNPCRTVQYAVDVASEGDVIKVATGVYTDVHALAAPPNYLSPPPHGLINQVVYITETITIRGGYAAPGFTEPPDPDVNPTTLDAERKGRVICIAGNISPTVEGLQITGGNGARQGGWHFDAGGGVYIVTATATISNNQIFGNYSGLRESYGGGLFLYHSGATISQNTISSNNAVFDAGGLYLVHSAATVSANTIENNVASPDYEGNGGGIFVLGNGPARITDNTIQNNVAGALDNSAGGGVYLVDSDAIVTGNAFRGNIASTSGSGFGGGICASGSPATIAGNTFFSNTASIGADGHGGGLMLSSNSPAMVTNNIIHNNVGSTAASGNGGGVRIWGSSVLLKNNTIYNNIASTVSFGYGGGISVFNSPATLTSNTVTGNLAFGGGGIELSWSDAVLSNNVIQGNMASGRGGGLDISGWAPVLTNTVVTDNALGQAAAVGSGIHVSSASPRLMHSTIARNHGGDGSGVHVTGYEWAGTYYSSTVRLTNTIMVSHTVGITVSTGDNASLHSTLWHANTTMWDGAGIISHTNDHIGDPAFTLDGYHLRKISAAIDNGIDTGVTTDIDGDSRPQDAGYDIGADEYHLSYSIYLPLVLRSGP